jgi:hypothetical protein
VWWPIRDCVVRTEYRADDQAKQGYHGDGNQRVVESKVFAYGKSCPDSRDVNDGCDGQYHEDNNGPAPSSIVRVHKVWSRPAEEDMRWRVQPAISREQSIVV